ncbi:hypothetical protein [uncultured Ferrimonas sp.]|uniref:hypothetical protein n=1 Tax=uncultured Ferrimonas sp. TaxID=432640 RepID=UPI00262F37B0|nr:hypothetical protein [uncultured Ferrimonas sp.]
MHSPQTHSAPTDKKARKAKSIRFPAYWADEFDRLNYHSNFENYIREAIYEKLQRDGAKL